MISKERLVNLRLLLKIGVWGLVGYFILDYLLKPNEVVMQNRQFEQQAVADYRDMQADEKERYQNVMGQVNELNIADANLAACIKKNLEIWAHLIKMGKMTNATDLTEIECYKKNISQLNGIEQFTQLKKLKLERNEIEYLDPLKDLTSLEELNVSDNPIKSLWEIASLGNLKGLNLSGIRVENLDDFLQFDGLQKLT